MEALVGQVRQNPRLLFFHSHALVNGPVKDAHVGTHIPLGQGESCEILKLLPVIARVFGRVELSIIAQAVEITHVVGNLRVGFQL